MSIVILGGGSVTTAYYVPALRLMGRLADTTIVDPDANAIKSQQPGLGEVKYCAEDYTSFLKTTTAPRENEKSYVIVAVPNQFHIDAVKSALEAQRHVLCEKPLALMKTNCCELRQLAAAKQLFLKVAMSRRYLPSLMLARDIVTADELGKVRSVQICDCTPFPWRPRSLLFFSVKAGGILADMGVHYLDYLDTLVGELKPLAYSDDAKGGVELSLQYELAAGDVRINMRLSRIHQTGAYVEINCDRGQIRVDKSNDNEVIVTPNGFLSRRVNAESPFDDPAWPKDFHGSFCQMLSDFERAISGRSTKMADAADAERTAGLIEWAYDQRSRTKKTKPIHSASTKVLVTGATGFIGGHLVERLTFAGDSIRVAARTPGTCANVSRFPVEIVQTNLVDRNSVSAAVAGARHVYHLAVGNDGNDNARITIDGTKNVVEASIEAGVDCVVVLSTMYVFGFPRGVADVDESFPYRPYGGEYGRSKAIMEQWCLDRARSSLPTRIVILNPTCVFGPAGSVYTILPVELAQQDQFCWISDGIGLCNYNYVDNLIDAIVAATRVPEAHGNRFIINDGAVSWREFLGPLIAPITPNVPSYTSDELARLARLARYGGPFRFGDLIKAVISTSEIRTVARRSASIRKVYAFMSRFKLRTPGQIRMTEKYAVSDSKIQTHLPPEGLASLYHSERVKFSANKAKAILGWSPRVDLAAAQVATLQWLVKSGRLPTQNTAAEAITMGTRKINSD